MHSFNEHSYPNFRERIFETIASETVLYELDLSALCVEDFYDVIDWISYYYYTTYFITCML